MIIIPTTYTPLRYPGGKSKLYYIIQPLVRSEMSTDAYYIEPFAGGAGLALKLLFCNDVGHIVLNDIDENVYLFWVACTKNPDELCSRIIDAELTIQEWEKQRCVLEKPNSHTDIERAFAFFFLNRCNRSGIINGGPIGGKKQDGKYTISARFNKDGLIKKIQSISRKERLINLYNTDASTFLQEQCLSYPLQSTIINIDPPYVNKGPVLYRNSFTKADHEKLSEIIKQLDYKWIVTYDTNELISELYKGYRIKTIELNYSAGKISKKGQEYLISNIGLDGEEVVSVDKDQ